MFTMMKNSTCEMRQKPRSEIGVAFCKMQSANHLIKNKQKSVPEHVCKIEKTRKLCSYLTMTHNIHNYT